MRAKDAKGQRRGYRSNGGARGAPEFSVGAGGAWETGSGCLARATALTAQSGSKPALGKTAMVTLGGAGAKSTCAVGWACESTLHPHFLVPQHPPAEWHSVFAGEHKDATAWTGMTPATKIAAHNRHLSNSRFFKPSSSNNGYFSASVPGCPIHSGPNRASAAITD